MGEGTGLGLAISHDIIRGLGGSMSVDSTVGQGSTFRVFLSVADPKEHEEPAPEPRSPAGRQHSVA